MSHSHRDENNLADPAVEEPAPVVEAPPPAVVVANTDLERSAAERRKADGAAEQIKQHEFTGDLPDPSRGGTDTETRLIFQGTDDQDDGAASHPAGAARRGPPAPRALHADDEGSWAAPTTLDSLGSGSFAVREQTWVAERLASETPGPSVPALTRPWIHPPTGE